MSEPTKQELLDFMRKHGPEKVDSITDTESAIRHFRCTSKIYKDQRDTLIDDLKVLREKNKELKEEMKRLHEESNITVFCALMEENTELNKENEKLMVVSKHYNTLTNHIRLKAEMNPSVSRYIDLVNYIDRLERADDER